MSGKIDNGAICFRLECNINNGIRVIIMDGDDEKLLSLIYKALVQSNLLGVEIWTYSVVFNNTGFIIPISQKELEELRELYQLYDFSDKIIFISDSTQYGTLFNYVKTGILTEQEMVDALLYKI